MSKNKRVIRKMGAVHIDNGPESARLLLEPDARPNEWIIVDRQSERPLGVLRQCSNNTCHVELFWGKGGFMAVVLSPQDLIYFALPGSEVEVSGTSLHLSAQTLEPSAAYPLSLGKVEEVNEAPGEKPNASSLMPQAETDQAMILGAGLATRFERISGQYTNYSKPAVPFFGNRSVIRCLADHLARHGYTRLLVNTYFKPESLKAGLASRTTDPGGEYAIRGIGYIDETEPSGTAGALRKLLMQPEAFSSSDFSLDLDKPLLVVQGDAVTDADFSALMNAHVAHDALVTIGCQPVADRDVDKFGIIVTERTTSPSGGDRDGDQSGRILGFQEKPTLAEARSRLGNTGFYIFSPRSFPLVREIYETCLREAQTKAIRQGQSPPDEIPFDFATDVFPRLLEKIEADPALGPFQAQQVSGYWSDIGNPTQYLNSVRDAYAGKVNLPRPKEPWRYYRDGIVYWEGAQEAAEREGARLAGNVVVALRFKP